MALGLSPRVRGNLDEVEVEPVVGGSIPARAGEPSLEQAPPDWCRVYPRACGGTRVTRPGWDADRGLSPRVRGNRNKNFHAKIRYRSIPACAGEPLELRVVWSHNRVYPRACGGTRIPINNEPLVPGLSPRVRGNPLGHALYQLRFGSIPARAGEPTVCNPVLYTSRVYPRACGGTTSCGYGEVFGAGLSPRVRGNL